MAINYTFAEAVAVLHAGTDMEAIADIGKRYPLMSHFANRILAKAGDDFAQFAQAMPEYLTAGKVNGAFKPEKVNEDADEVEQTEEKPVEAVKADKPKGKRGRPKKVVEPVAEPDPDEDVSTDDDADGMPDFDGMGNADLLEFIDQHKARGRMKSRKKPDMVELCKTIWAEQNGDSDADSEPVEDDKEQETVTDEYSGKTAKELYLMAKKRGLKLEQKKSAEFYADALRKADAAESAEDDEDEDWGDDEDETPAPAPAPVKKEKKAEKKPAKKPVPADDEDEWDI